MQSLNDRQKNAFDQSVPALGTHDSGSSAGDIINSLFLLGGTLVTYTTNAAAGTQDTVAHDLGYVPKGYIPVDKSAAVDIYTGAAANDTNLYLKATVASVTVTLLVF